MQVNWFGKTVPKLLILVALAIWHSKKLNVNGLRSAYQGLRKIIPRWCHAIIERSFEFGLLDSRTFFCVGWMYSMHKECPAQYFYRKKLFVGILRIFLAVCCWLTPCAAMVATARGNLFPQYAMSWHKPITTLLAMLDAAEASWKTTYVPLHRKTDTGPIVNPNLFVTDKILPKLQVFS